VGVFFDYSTLSGLTSRLGAFFRTLHIRLFKFKPFGLRVSPPPIGGGREGAAGYSNSSPSGLGILLPRLEEAGRGLPVIQIQALRAWG